MNAKIDTKTALLDVAEHAVRSRGFDGFSYADLAQAVGIRKASIHYHFPTKANLSAALIDRYTEAIKAHCRRIEEENDTAGRQLLGLIALYRDALNEGSTLCLCVSLTSSHESLSEDVTAKVNGFRDMVVDWLRAVFERGLTDGSITGLTAPELEARSSLAMLEGAQLAARSAGDSAVFDDATEALAARCKADP